jgi:hypothetical protein
MLKSNKPSRRLSTLMALCAAAVFSLQGSASAQLITYDGFDYPLGTTPDGSLNGGTGWADGGSWAYTTGSTGNGGSITYGLSYTDGNGAQLTTSGAAYHNLGNSVGSTAGTFSGRNFSDTLGNLAATNGGTLWLSFLWRDNSPGTNALGTNFFRGASVCLLDSTVGTATIAAEMGMPHYGFGGTTPVVKPTLNFSVYGSGGQYNPTYVSNLPGISNTAFVVLKLTVDNTTGNLDSFQIWLNPLLGAGEPTNSSTGYFTNYTGLEISAHNMFNIRASGISASRNILVVGEEVVDEIRLGNIFGDVTPFTAPAAPPTITASLSGGSLNLAWPQSAPMGLFFRAQAV